MCQGYSKSPSHFFVHWSYASRFWHIILEAFGWLMACSNNIFDILASLLVGYPFSGTKKTIWLVMLHAFFWTFWGERNNLLFRDFFFPLLIGF